VIIHERISAVELCALPWDHINARHFIVTVEIRAPGKYAVMHGGHCLGADGVWDYEPTVTERTNEWLESHRFGWHEALRRAAAATLTVSVNGHTAGQALAKEASQ